jgi:hypothetical protein
LESYFPAVADVILSGRGKAPTEVQRLLRRHVCAQCSMGSEASCSRRDTLECALERYMPLIIERIGSLSVGWTRV